ncbi:MAG: hypothetical protein K1X66_04335 [Verrucomicrobiae bacterium]|nr:hypothetical protein [Verrucomicrobiae bacterium]
MVNFLSWSLTISYPIANLLLAILFIYHARSLPYRCIFIILGVSSLIGGCVQFLDLLLRLQKAWEIVLINQELARQLWWIRVPLDLLSTAFYVLAIFLLIQKMKKFYGAN